MVTIIPEKNNTNNRNTSNNKRKTMTRTINNIKL